MESFDNRLKRDFTFHARFALTVFKEKIIALVHLFSVEYRDNMKHIVKKVIISDDLWLKGCESTQMNRHASEKGEVETLIICPGLPLGRSMRKRSNDIHYCREVHSNNFVTHLLRYGPYKYPTQTMKLICALVISLKFQHVSNVSNAVVIGRHMNTHVFS